MSCCPEPPLAVSVVEVHYHRGPDGMELPGTLSGAQRALAAGGTHGKVVIEIT
jgi:hypothetical protein